jgi:hypothetical protein
MAVIMVFRRTVRFFYELESPIPIILPQSRKPVRPHQIAHGHAAGFAQGVLIVILSLQIKILIFNLQE